ncbi:nucleotide exchange factor GrpE [Novipirellula artificiosorum]|uniref:Protein GrpE n=1 Tax=Novipirellula artificiosorum TaxID=2528016 RepID=A0A5C6DDP4_9BACT|nr:nucleotide exchange factor GrpE [Novipirellula artificiosorum]TWU33336.1 heat shock protein GrpE [Novipirellula artificiosorum]
MNEDRDTSMNENESIPEEGWEAGEGPDVGEHFDSDQLAKDVVHAETRDEEIERLRASSDSAEKRVLMAQAEAENFRKRMRRDFEDQLRFAAMPLVNDLLLVRDNLHRAIEAAESTSDAAGLREGVAMVVKQLDDTLAKHSVTPIPTEGQVFDPNVHEAISQMPSDEHPAGAVSHVAVIGYQMHDRVVRPSQVVVSSGPPQ